MAETKIRGSSQIQATSINPAQIDLSQNFTFTGDVVAQTPTADGQVATKLYVDNVAAGLDIKDSVQYGALADVLGTSGSAFSASGGSDNVGEFTGLDFTDDANF